MQAEVSRPRLKVVLASRSPQRRDLLERLRVLFEVAVPEVEEVGEGDPADAVLENARRKASVVGAPDALVIGCDTDVVVDDHALGKPADEDVARSFIEQLSGRSHEVLSGLVLLGPEPDRIREGVARSVVSFGGGSMRCAWMAEPSVSDLKGGSPLRHS